MKPFIVGERGLTVIVDMVMWDSQNTRRMDNTGLDRVKKELK